MNHAAKTISALATEVLAQVEREEGVKTAQLAAVRAAQPRFRTEAAPQIHKLAAELRAMPTDVTYDDLHAFIGGRL